MTEKDKELVKKAESLNKRDWIEMTELAKQTESDEAYNIIHRMAVNGYHLEEADCGMI